MLHREDSYRDDGLYIRNFWLAFTSGDYDFRDTLYAFDAILYYW